MFCQSGGGLEEGLGHKHAIFSAGKTVLDGCSGSSRLGSSLNSSTCIFVNSVGDFFYFFSCKCIADFFPLGLPR